MRKRYRSARSLTCMQARPQSELPRCTGPLAQHTAPTRCVVARARACTTLGMPSACPWDVEPPQVPGPQNVLKHTCILNAWRTDNLTIARGWVGVGNLVGGPAPPPRDGQNGLGGGAKARNKAALTFFGLAYSNHEHYLL